MALEIPSLRVLRLQAESDVEVEINGSLSSRLRTALAFALAGIGFAFLTALQFLSRQFFVDTADETFALLWASIFGITPNPATQAAGPTRMTGSLGSTFAGGELLTRPDGASYFVDGPHGPIGATSEITVQVKAVEAGEGGNTVVGTVLTFGAGEAPAGVDDVTIVISDGGVEGIVDGFDAESLASIKARTLQKIRAPNRGGSEPDYVVWATSIAGIAQAFARGSFAGIGTVLVIVASEWDPTQTLGTGNTPVPSPTLIAEVEAFLELNKPAGLFLVAVQPPVLQSLDPNIELTPDTTEIRAAVTRSLALALAEVEPGGTAFYDDLVDSINRAAGEEHHRLFIGGSNVNNTVVGDNSLLIPGTIDWVAP